jgi:hypothetical protein
MFSGRFGMVLFQIVCTVERVVVTCHNYTRACSNHIRASEIHIDCGNYNLRVEITLCVNK